LAPQNVRAPVDLGQLKLGGVIDLDGMPRGAAAGILPPKAVIPAARLSPGSGLERDAPLVRRLDGTISDICVGGGGRYLLVTLKDTRKVAVFDVNAAEVVKTIDLPSPNALVAAGSSRFLIAFPDEKLLQRWDLGTLKREGGSRLSPIDGQLLALVMGCDSDGPALALWAKDTQNGTLSETQFSFLDLDTLAVLKVGLVATSGGSGSISTTGGSFRINSSLSERANLRASAGGALFGLSPSLRTLTILGKAILVIDTHDRGSYLAPGPDGRTVYSGLTGRLDADLQPKAATGMPQPTLPVVTMPSSDPSYYLSISGLPDAVTQYDRPYTPKPYKAEGPVTASVHAAGDGLRLLTIHGLDEMAFEIKAEDLLKVKGEFFQIDFTLDKRFYLVPQARLLVTVPWTNDRLVLRHLDIDEALEQSSGNYLVVTSSPTLIAQAGSKLEHQIVSRSRQGDIQCSVVSGPAELSVARDGQLSWVVPSALQGEDVTALIRVRDAAGQERSHELRIRIQ
jgi:hypothetical protein